MWLEVLSGEDAGRIVAVPPGQAFVLGRVQGADLVIRDAQASRRHVEAARRPRVLLAGVDANTRAVTRVAVGDRVDVEEAPQGESLIEAVRDGRPDLVILDWNAPGQPAREVVAALRADAVARDAKVLLLIEHKQTSSGDVVAAGADERLAAPFSPLQLQVKLRKLLGAEAVAG